MLAPPDRLATTPRRSPASFLWRFGSGLLVFALVAILYGRVLNLPLYWDDARHYEYSRTPTLAQIWINDTGYGYYRPAIFTFYKFAFNYLTPQLTFVCYGAGLVLHAVNSLLAGKVTVAWLRFHRPARGPLDAPALAGGLAALFFVAYPYTLYVVASFASIMHLCVTGLALTGVLATLKFVRAPRRRWLVVMGVCAALAPWFHEAGVVVAACLTAGLVILNWRLAWRHKVALALMQIPVGVFGLAWLTVHKTRGATRLVDLKTMGESLAVFVQALTFPVQPAAKSLMSWLGAGETPAVWAVALPALLALGWVLWKSGQWRVVVFALIWFGLATAPVIMILPYWYIVPSPRLLYDVGPAVVLLWVLAFIAAARLAPLPGWGRTLLAVGLTLAALAVPVSFTWNKLTLFEVSLAPLRQMASAARAAPADTDLVVNPAEWVADVTDLYPLGRWGVSIAPNYVTLTELVAINAGRGGKFAGAYFPPLRTEMAGHNWAVYDEAHPLDWADLAQVAPRFDRVWVTTYTGDRIDVEEAGTVRNGAVARPSTYLASFEDKVYLVDASYQAAGPTVTLTLTWKYAGPNPDATVFRHVLDCAGNLIGSGDGYALGRTLPFGLLQPGAEVRDIRRVPVEAAPGDNCRSLEVGLFRDDGSRVHATAPDGTGFENEAVPLR